MNKGHIKRISSLTEISFSLDLETQVDERERGATETIEGSSTQVY